MDSEVRRCEFCASIGLYKRCSGCQKVSYCSKLCQQQDWINHKEACKSAWTAASSSASATKRKGNSIDDLRNGGVQNCFKDTNDCKDRQTDASKPAISEEIKTCNVCGKTDTDMKKCGKCKKVAYCGVTCQKSDWKNHKQFCGKSSEEHVKFDTGLGDMFKNMKVTVGSEFMDPLNNPQKYERTEAGFLAYKEMQDRARRLYPGYTIINDIRRLTFQCRLGWVLVARICCLHPYVARHGVMLEDVKRNDAPVFFYLDFDNPQPYFSWDDLVPGNYICFQNPHLHQFMDGQVGFRIDNADVIKVLKL